MTFEWREEYSVKIKEIDDQHKKLFEMILNLESITHNTDFDLLIKNILEDLMEYVNIHFETEEYYFKKCNYAATDIHIGLHKEIKDNLNEKINLFFSRDMTALDIVGFHNFLLNWLKHHILEQDQMYVQALKEYHD